MPMKGAQEHRNRLQKLAGNAVADLAGAIVYEGADIIRADAFRKISAGSVSGKGHVASKPGEYPNRDDGDLQGGLQAERTGKLTAEVRSTAPHARPLEYGAVVKDGFGKGLQFTIEARPHMRPSRDAKAKEIRDKLADNFGKLVKLSG